MSSERTGLIGAVVEVLKYSTPVVGDTKMGYMRAIAGESESVSVSISSVVVYSVAADALAVSV
jgi:hypothetical protein